MILHKPSKDSLESIKQDTSLPKGSYCVYTTDIEESLKILETTKSYANLLNIKII